MGSSSTHHSQAYIIGGVYSLFLSVIYCIATPEQASNYHTSIYIWLEIWFKPEFFLMCGKGQGVLSTRNIYPKGTERRESRTTTHQLTLFVVCTVQSHLWTIELVHQHRLPIRRHQFIIWPGKWFKVEFLSLCVIGQGDLSTHIYCK